MGVLDTIARGIDFNYSENFQQGQAHAAAMEEHAQKTEKRKLELDAQKRTHETDIAAQNKKNTEYVREASLDAQLDLLEDVVASVFDSDEMDYEQRLEGFFQRNMPNATGPQKASFLNQYGIPGTWGPDTREKLKSARQQSIHRRDLMQKEHLLEREWEFRMEVARLNARDKGKIEYKPGHSLGALRHNLIVSASFGDEEAFKQFNNMIETVYGKEMAANHSVVATEKAKIFQEVFPQTADEDWMDNEKVEPASVYKFQQYFDNLLLTTEGNMEDAKSIAGLYWKVEKDFFGNVRLRRTTETERLELMGKVLMGKTEDDAGLDALRKKLTSPPNIYGTDELIN